MIRQTSIRVTTTGSAGSAAGTGISSYPIVGRVVGLNVNFHASAPATTDTTIRTTAAPTYNIWAISNSVTDVFVQPAGKPVDNANAAITNAHAPIPVADYITVSVAQCDALTDAVVVTVLYEE